VLWRCVRSEVSLSGKARLRRLTERLLSRRPEARLLTVGAAAVLRRVRIRERRRLLAVRWRLTEATLLRRRLTKPSRLLLTVGAAATVLIVGEGHRLQRERVTVRAIARAWRDVVAHLATKRCALSWRRGTILALRRRSEALRRRWEPLRGRSEALRRDN